jgi:transcriptional regulator with PAS, ATPase and Fis domain
VSVNIRVITATNKNLEEMVARDAYREDLYYRINVVKITMPPLRDRWVDIPLLAEMFISRFNRMKGKNIDGLSSDAMSLLLAHDFPGNVRELENAIEHAFVLCPGGLIEPRHLPTTISGDSRSTIKSKISLNDMEAQTIVTALRKNDWNRSQTARQLGIHPSTLWRKMKKFDISFTKTRA